MFLEEFSSQDLVVFTDDLDQAVRILGMISNQIGECLDLALEAIEPPENVPNPGVGIRGVCRFGGSTLPACPGC